MREQLRLSIPPIQGGADPVVAGRRWEAGEALIEPVRTWAAVDLFERTNEYC